jgi:ParB family chromosome partitioning protein
MRGEIDMGHARALLPLAGALAGPVGAAGSAEGPVGARNRAPGSVRPQSTERGDAERPDRDVLRLQEELADLLGAQVAIRSPTSGAPARC